VLQPKPTRCFSYRLSKRAELTLLFNEILSASILQRQQRRNHEGNQTPGVASSTQSDMLAATAAQRHDDRTWWPDMIISRRRILCVAPKQRRSKMNRLAGKTALITGAAQGLGAAMAHKFAAEGARVVLTDINVAGAAAVAAAINAEVAVAGTAAVAASIGHDVTRPDDWDAAIAFAEATFGGLHILVNNAGIAAGSNVEATSFEDWRRVHSIDLDSVFLGCKLALPLMARTVRDTGVRGSIVNISSIAGVIAGHNSAAYNSAKAGVRHLTKSVALHCAKQRYRITCNSIHPVFIDTPILDNLTGALGREEGLAKLGRQIPLGAVGEPDDVAWAAVYLASDEAKMVTGHGLYVDGGISAM
jgi:NAD(P)-dependent dehydrogenase (short-subunit alcohol dehydrogenase family)